MLGTYTAAVYARSSELKLGGWPERDLWTDLGIKDGFVWIHGSWIPADDLVGRNLLTG